jgi:hypothetical protein
MPRLNPTEAPELHVSPVVNSPPISFVTDKLLFGAQFSTGVPTARLYVALGRISYNKDTPRYATACKKKFTESTSPLNEQKLGPHGAHSRRRDNTSGFSEAKVGFVRMISEDTLGGVDAKNKMRD